MESRKLNIEDIYVGNGTYSTVFSIETNTQTKEREVHIFGYCYTTGVDEPKPFRDLEYCGFYLPLNIVLNKGLDAAEIEYGEDVKSYIEDLESETDVLEIYNNYVGENNGTCHPPMILKKEKFNTNTPDGIYILKSHFAN